jgi:hypothetical protein
MNPILTRFFAGDENNEVGISVAAAPAVAVVLIKSRLFILLDIPCSSLIWF